MNEIVKKFNTKDYLKYLFLAGTGLILIIIITVLSFQVTKPTYTSLYSNLDSEDLNSIVNELNVMAIEYKINKEGNQILVPSSNILRLRMNLAQKGLPNKSNLVGYEIFDKESAIGTSNFVLNVNLLRALEGELSRTISSISSVKKARVHLVVPQKEVFKRSKAEPTASVILSIHGSKTLEKKEIQAIVHLVSSAVEGLKSENVTVIDNKGILLNKSKANSSSPEGSVDAEGVLEYKVALEQKLKDRVEFLLSEVVGQDAVRAEITADIDFDKVNIVSEQYDPESQVARSVQTSTENSKSQDGNIDNVSVENNIPNANKSTSNTGSLTANEKADEIRNFEISKVVTNKISEVGKMKKVSIAVLVDGKYEKGTDEQGKEVITYKPRSEEEVDTLTRIVKTAIGFDEKRGDSVSVVNMRFERINNQLIPQEGLLETILRDFGGVIKTVVLGLVATMVILFLVRPIIQKTLNSPKSVIDESIFEDKEIEEDEVDVALKDMKVKTENELGSKISQIISANPEKAVGVLRKWMMQKS